MGCMHAAWIVVVASCAAAPAEVEPSLVGVTWDGRAVSISVETGAATELGMTGYTRHNALARSGSGELLATQTAGGSPQPVPGMVIEIDALTGAGAPKGALESSLDVREIAFAPSDEMYALVDGGTPTEPDLLYGLDPVTGSFGLIGATGQVSMQAMAVSAQGVVYAWSMAPTFGLGPGLMTIDPATGEASDVNGGDLWAHRFQGMAFLPDGRLVGVTTDSGPGYGALSHRLFEIDPESGAPVEIGALGAAYDVRGIAYVPAPGSLVLAVAAFTLCLPRSRWRYAGLHGAD